MSDLVLTKTKNENEKKEPIVLPSGIVVPDDAIQLSTKVWVTFNEIPQEFLTENSLRLFQAIKLDDQGNISINQSDPTKAIKSVSEVQKHHSTLISFGVNLIGIPSDYRDNSWIRQFKNSGLSSTYDMESEEDINFVFLRYIAFDVDDWTMLDQHFMGQ